MNLSRYINHCILTQTASLADVEKACAEAKAYGFATVSVPPLYAKKANEYLSGSEVKLCTAIGYPFGYSAIEAKVAEIVLAMVDGVDVLDMVINVSAVKNNDWTFLANEINTVLPIIRERGKTLKVTIESGLLTDEEVMKCCDIYGAAGVGFLKTSTGVAAKGASIHAVQLIRAHLADQVQIEASGGIRSFSFAKELINSGANMIGCTESIFILEESRYFFEKNN